MHVVAYGLDTALLAGCVVWMVALMSAAGWHHRVHVTGGYVRDPDIFGLPPAFVAYLWRGGSSRTADAAATLLDLVDRGVVRLERVGSPAGHHAWTHTDAYRLHRDSAACADLLPHERLVLSLVFDLDVEGADAVSSVDLQHYLRHHHRGVLAGMAAFVRIVDQDAQEAAGSVLYSDRGDKLRHAVPAAVAIGGSAVLWATFSAPACVTGMVAGAVMALVAFELAVPKISIVRTRAEGLRCYLKDVGTFEKRPAEAVVLWSKYLVYAVAFGLDDVAGEALWAPRIFDLKEAEVIDVYSWAITVDLSCEETPAPIRRIASEALPTLLPLIDNEDAPEGLWSDVSDALSGRGEAPLKIPRT
jgi:hypothetical protein